MNTRLHDTCTHGHSCNIFKYSDHLRSDTRRNDSNPDSTGGQKRSRLQRLLSFPRVRHRPVDGRAAAALQNMKLTQEGHVRNGICHRGPCASLS